MRLTKNLFNIVLAASCLAIAACGGSGSQSSASTSASGSSWSAAATARASALSSTASPSGTTIPSATQGTDSSGNIWTVSDGVIYENGGPAGFSGGVTL